jgi:hypothetical protein
MLRLSALLFLALAAQGHSISVSTSEGLIEGTVLDLHLRMPKYEADHIPKGPNGAPNFPSAFLIANATFQTIQCNPLGDNLNCHLSYQFQNNPPDDLAVNVTLARITVPNHVHIMRLTRAGMQRQGVFDRTFEQETFHFGRAGYWQGWWRGARLGLSQLLYQHLLLLLVLAIGILSVPAAYVAVAGAAFFLVLPDQFYAPPAFFELAAALALLYLAVEARFFPNANGRWVVAAAIGLLEGAALAVLARPAGLDAVAFGTGNLVGQALLCALGSRFLRKLRSRSPQHLATVLIAVGTFALLWMIALRG